MLKGGGWVLSHTWLMGAGMHAGSVMSLIPGAKKTVLPRASDKSTMLAGMEVMKRFLKAQPLLTMQQSHQQIIAMLEPAFCSGSGGVINLLCDVLRAIYKPFPVPSQSQPADLPKEVHVSYLEVLRHTSVLCPMHSLLSHAKCNVDAPFQ